MKDSLAVGISGSARHLVTPDMSPAHLPNKVLSTPSMVQLIEMTCLTTAQAHLDDNETTVGVHICVSHSASVAAGEEVEVRCELTERDRRRLTFATTVEVWGPRRVRGHPSTLCREPRVLAYLS